MHVVHDGMALIRLYILLGLLGGEVMQGFAPRYDPGGMERMAKKHGIALDMCHISSAYYPIGTPIYVYGLNTGVLRWCIVSDVSADVDTTGRNSSESDRERHKRTKRIIEVGYAEALSLCGKAHINDPPKRCPVIVYKVEE